MGNVSLLEFSHDFAPRNEDLRDWAYQIRQYMNSADAKFLPTGVKKIEFRHVDDHGRLDLLHELLYQLACEHDAAMRVLTYTHSAAPAHRNPKQKCDVCDLIWKTKQLLGVK